MTMGGEREGDFFLKGGGGGGQYHSTGWTEQHEDRMVRQQ